jgi:hypothetical protein
MDTLLEPALTLFGFIAVQLGTACVVAVLNPPGGGGERK